MEPFKTVLFLFTTKKDFSSFALILLSLFCYQFRGFPRYTLRRYKGFPIRNTWILISFDHNFVLTCQKSEKVIYKPHRDNLSECFLLIAFARIISVLPNKLKNILKPRGEDLQAPSFHDPLALVPTMFNVDAFERLVLRPDLNHYWWIFKIWCEWTLSAGMESFSLKNSLKGSLT